MARSTLWQNSGPDGGFLSPLNLTFQDLNSKSGYKFTGIVKAEERGLSLFCFLEELDDTKSLQWSVAGTSDKHLEHNMLGSGKRYFFPWMEIDT